jgi:hypothetical protein
VSAIIEHRSLALTAGNNPSFSRGAFSRASNNELALPIRANEAGRATLRRMSSFVAQREVDAGPSHVGFRRRS